MSRIRTMLEGYNGGESCKAINWIEINTVWKTATITTYRVLQQICTWSTSSGINTIRLQLDRKLGHLQIQQISNHVCHQNGPWTNRFIRLKHVSCKPFIARSKLMRYKGNLNSRHYRPMLLWSFRVAFDKLVHCRELLFVDVCFKVSWATVSPIEPLNNIR